MNHKNKNIQNHRQRIWAVGSGKGGVGKSQFAANLSILLANLDQSVVGVDLDLGNANMHTFLGIKYPQKTLIDFVTGKIKDLNEIIIDTPIYNLKLICGSSGVVGSANSVHAQKLKLIRYLENLHVDNVVVDLGAGTSYNTIDFFLSATDHIVVTTPDTIALQSIYNFLRICVFRKLHSIFRKNWKTNEILEKAKIPTANGVNVKVQTILEDLHKIDPEGVKKFREFQKNFKPWLIVNMLLKKSENRLGFGIKEVVKRYLDIDVEYVGSISYDNEIRESLSIGVPHIINSPRAISSTEVFSIIPKIIGDASNRNFMKETIHRELSSTRKTYNQRIIEHDNLDIDPSIYAVDKIKKTGEVPEKNDTSDFFKMIKPASWSTIAIDLGTSSTLIFVKGRGVILNEPSIMSIEENTGKIVALGSEAKAMTGRVHSGIRIVSPLEHGAIQDYADVKMMILEFIKRAKKSAIFIRPAVVLTIKPNLTSVEKRAFSEFIKGIGAREVHLIYEPLASAIGAGLPVDIPKASMLVNIGGGSITAIVISISGIVAIASERVGGKMIDASITRYLREKHNFIIGDQTAEWIKINFGQAMKIKRDNVFKVRGQDIEQGIPLAMSINTAEIREAISKPVERMVKVIRDLLEEVPPELSGDLVDRGMVLTGGGAFLKGFDTLVAERTGIKVTVAHNALTATVEGAGRILEDMNMYKKFFIEEIDI
jgi:rod shape-determining protein MreB and related proteins